MHYVKNNVNSSVYRLEGCDKPKYQFQRDSIFLVENFQNIYGKKTKNVVQKQLLHKYYG